MTSLFIKPKESRRLVLTSNAPIVPKEIFDSHVIIHEPISVQLQTEFHKDGQLYGTTAVNLNACYLTKQ